MLYTILNVKGKELKLRLNANMTVQVEKQIGKNPLSILMALENGEMPKLNDLLIILWGSLQALNKGYTISRVWELYDEYISEGHSITDLVSVIMDVMKVSGFIKNEDEEESDEIDEFEKNE